MNVEKITDTKAKICCGGRKCPILENDVTFVECFICKNFLRRIKGKIECAGDPL